MRTEMGSPRQMIRDCAPAREDSGGASRRRAAPSTPPVVRLPADTLAGVHQAVLAWYARVGRDLPWRHTCDPYHILVAEIMLQQTQVDRVLPKYQEFLAVFPTAADLAAAPRAEVIRRWSPLGYNLRAVRLHEIARQAVERFGGQLPDTLDALMSLKGVGRYTAAVACFAWGHPEPVMDTNVRRVLGRIFAADVPGATEDDRLAWSLAEAALPGGLPAPPEVAGVNGPASPDRADGEAAATQAATVYSWNQALMDLGATICVSRAPRCPLCPVAALCASAGTVGAAALTDLPLFASVAEGEMRPVLVAEGRVAYVTGGDLTPQPPSLVAGEDDLTPRPPSLSPVGKSLGRGRASGEGSLPLKAPKAPAERFEGSRRWYRGRLVAALRQLGAGESLSLAEAGAQIKPDYAASDEPWLRELAGSLARDGLITLVQQPDGSVWLALPE